jgi:hypothetical protein
MKGKKLSSKDIDKLVEQIRSLYDDYMVKFIQGSAPRKAFEERYFDALKSRINLQRFLMVELKIVQQMIVREERLQGREEAEAYLREKDNGGGEGQDGANGGRKSGEDAAAQGDFADRVIEQMQRKAEQYPPAGLDNNEVWEVDHLFGGLQKFERELWPPVDRVYRKVYPSRYDGPRLTLETRLLELAEARMGGIPQVLHTLQLLMGRFPRNYREIEWEKKQTILKASFFLHTIKGELEKLRQESYLSEEERRTVFNALEYVNALIADFRLKDLKEKEK